MRDKVFAWIANLTYRRYGWVLLIALVVTFILGGLSQTMRLEMTWIDIVPEHEPQVQEFKHIIDVFGNLNGILVAIDGPNTEELKKVAEELVIELKKLETEAKVQGKIEHFKVVKRVDYKEDMDFWSNHGLVLVKAKDLKRLKRVYADLNLVPLMTHLNDDFEREYVGEETNLRKEEDEAVRGLDGIMAVLASIKQTAETGQLNKALIREAVEQFVVGEKYLLSKDKKMILLIAQPTMSSQEIEKTVAGVKAIFDLFGRFHQRYPHLRFGMTGIHVISHDEMTTALFDTYRNTAFAFVLILALFIFSFRMWSAPILAMITLTLGITWDIGIMAVVVGRMTLFTAFVAVVLIGLGVDYAIHLVSAYTEFRHRGHSLPDSLGQFFSRVGPGLLTGALTTAIAFLMLLLAGARFFRELGFVVGIGILCCLVATLFVLPAMLVLRERMREKIFKKKEVKRVSLVFGFLGGWAQAMSRHPWAVLSLSIALTVFLFIQALKIQFNPNYLDMEAEGLQSIELQDELVERFQLSMDNLMATYTDLEQVEEVSERLDDLRSVSFWESISFYVPSEEKQSRRKGLLKEIQALMAIQKAATKVERDRLIQELERLEDNVIEVSQLSFIGGLDKVFYKCNQILGWDEEGNQVGINQIQEVIAALKRPTSPDPLLDYQKGFVSQLTQKISRMANPTEVTLDLVPENIKQRYISPDGKLYLVNAYPRENVWKNFFNSPFLRNVPEIMPRATGVPILMQILYRAASRSGALATILAFCAIVILLLIDFHSIRLTIMALVPLLMGAIWMLGFMTLFSWKLDPVNIMATPLILGIGIDDGVHVIHRYLKEGKGSIRYVLSSTGKAITLTSLTTMLAFGSFVFAVFRGYQHLGQVLFTGVGLCFFTSVTVLSALIGLMERWHSKKTSR